MKATIKFCYAHIIICALILCSSLFASHTYEITDMGVALGGVDHCLEQDKWLIDTIGQYVSGMHFGTGVHLTASLSSGYRFPVQIPIITNIMFQAESNTVNLSWQEDVDYIWLSETNQFLPKGSDFARTAEDFGLEKTAIENFSDDSHSNWKLRFYQIAFEDEFAEEIAGKITSPLLIGWNFLSVPFEPMTNELSFLFDGQLNPGKEISYPLGDVIYAKATDSDMVLPNFYINSASESSWHVLEKSFLDLNRSFYIRIHENSTAKQVVFTGFVPLKPKTMTSLTQGWNLVSQPYPVSVPLDKSDLWESGLEPGTLTKNGHSGDAVFAQKNVDKNVLIGTFLQENNDKETPDWIGPMSAELEPGKGYWIYVKEDHPGVQNWFYPLPYYITPIEF